MIMTERDEQLPRPAAELEQQASYYDSHDTSAETGHGTRAEPQPMATTSLRLPADVISQLKLQAQARHIRCTTYVRSILEHAARDRRHHRTPGTDRAGRNRRPRHRRSEHGLNSKQPRRTRDRRT
jgi:hypothetical protein